MQQELEQNSDIPQLDYCFKCLCLIKLGGPVGQIILPGKPS